MFSLGINLCDFGAGGSTFLSTLQFKDIQTSPNLVSIFNDASSQAPRSNLNIWIKLSISVSAMVSNL